MSILVAVVAIFFAGMGAAALVRPAVIWAPFGVEPTTPAARVGRADGPRVPVRGERLQGADEERAWERIATEAPEYVTYRSRTHRSIPIIRLERTDS